MFIIIAAIQNNEKYCDIYLIEHLMFRDLKWLICKLAMCFLCKLAMRCRMTATETIRDHHHWTGILMMLVSKQTNKMISLANCCVGEAEPAGQTVMERRWRRRNAKQLKVMKCCLSSEHKTGNRPADSIFSSW